MTTARSEAIAAGMPEQRLHPLSWLFELFNVLKQFIVPLLILLFTGRGDRYEFWGLIGAGVMVPLAVARYYSFRYRIGADRIVIRSGLLQRTVRDIAFTRIQNVSLHRNPLHRLMGVAEVRLETGGGDKEEGRMRVLGLPEAERLRQLVRSGEAETPPAGAGVADDDAGNAADAPLLQLDWRELLKLGLVSNKGMVLVAAGLGAAFQFDQGLARATLNRAAGWLWNQGAELTAIGPARYALAGLLVLLVAFVALRLISVAQAFLHYHGFTLRADRQRLSLARGLLNRFEGALPRTRIQAWTLRQSWLQRQVARFDLRVDAAGGKGAKSETMEAHWQLAPIADAEQVAGIINTVLPARAWPVDGWRPLHPDAWKREFKAPALFLLVPAAILVYWLHAWGLLLLLSHPWLWFQSKQWAKHAGYSYGNGLIAVREGWIGKTWRFAEVRKVQAVYLKQSPFDRRHGMATVFCDTVNAGSFEPPLAVRYLPLAEAVALHDAIAAAIAE
ncbi:PH domain-containing protein [Arenimonas maotaiensis]|nr:PH domain-containing protein [Arenimonas maotaiensis]